MNKNILIIILARKGSLRIKNKNMRIFNNKPLISWTIEQALRIKNSNKRVILSTDSEEILDYSKKFKDLEKVKRPKSISTSKSSSFEAIRHIIKKIKYEGNIILLQPTSPLRSDKDIKEVIKLMIRGKSPIMSICECVHNSSLITNCSPTKKFIPINNKLEKLYYPNGAIYAAHTSWIKKNNTFYTKKTYTYLMPQERSIDIDYEFQFITSETLFKKNFNKKNQI